MKVHEATRRRNSVTGDEYSNRSNLGTKEVLSQSLYFHPLSVALSTKEAVSVSISISSVWISISASAAFQPLARNFSRENTSRETGASKPLFARKDRAGTLHARFTFYMWGAVGVGVKLAQLYKRNQTPLLRPPPPPTRLNESLVSCAPGELHGPVLVAVISLPQGEPFATRKIILPEVAKVFLCLFWFYGCFFCVCVCVCAVSYTHLTLPTMAVV